jgi:hypothetical protein
VIIVVRRGMEVLKPDAEDAIPVDDGWSLPLLFGSEASAQQGQRYTTDELVARHWPEQPAGVTCKILTIFLSQTLRNALGSDKVEKVKSQNQSGVNARKDDNLVMKYPVSVPPSPK